MKTELKAKFLQHLNQKKAEKGFTLIELLVVIIIIGILAAIALPTFLNQTAKGKQSEAKQNIASINKNQASNRLEKNAFTTSFDVLALGSFKTTSGSVAGTFNYTYTLSTSGVDQTASFATSGDTALKSYSGGVTRYNNATGLSVTASIICEASAPGVGADLPMFGTNTAPITCTSPTTVEVTPG